MAVFVYSALKKDGSLAKGELTASDRADAIDKLGRGGMQPLSVKAAEDAATASGSAKSSGTKAATKEDRKAEGAAAPQASGKPATKTKTEKIEGMPATKKEAAVTGPVKLKKKEVVMLTEELSDLLAAGLQLEPALKIMESRDELSALKDVTSLLRSKIRDGSSFANALRSSSPSFGDLYCNLAAAGEISGALPKILRRQSEYLVGVQELTAKVTTAMIYPICLVVAGLGVSLLFVSYLIPQLATLLKSMGKELPLPAKALMAGSNVILSPWGLVIFLVVGLMTWGFQEAVSNPRYKPAWDFKKLHLPFFGPLIRDRFFVQFLETLSNLVGNGLPLLRALELTREATVNVHLRSLLAGVISMVGEGGSLSRSLKKVGFFPSLLTDIITVGEQTGDLEHSLQRAAERYDKELQKTIDRGMAMLTPMIILVMAVVVGAMAWMMISVILESVSSIKR